MATLTKNLFKAFKENDLATAWNDRNFFYCNDECQKQLTTEFGLTSDCNEQYMNGFVLRFNWRNEKWAVAA